MNLADSIKLVLKSNNSALNLFLKEDLSSIVSDFKTSWMEIFRNSKNLFVEIRQHGFTPTLLEVSTSLKSLVIIFRHLPKRIVDGLNFFKEDFLVEIENCQDPKEKTIVSLKVLGALTHLSILTFYEIKKGNLSLKFKGLGPFNKITSIIVAELIFKMTTSFVLRLMDAVDENLDNQEGEKQFSYFRQLILKKELDQNVDSSVVIVEKFKKYIMTGER